ncbi:MAG: 1-acyl-sn-glycerol-3-phosphate acyltransferase [Blastocatellia bacterium]|nr:1-acyl-sn-glycerol-3-phosphate acyltransferase [Blastocatellia bacterium]
MRSLSAIFKAIAFSLATIGFYSLWLVVAPFVYFFATPKRRWRNFIFRHWAKTIVSVLGIKIRTNEIVPATPFFLVSNHLSYLDIVVLASQLDCVFIAKREVESWPVFGLLSRSMNTIFIDRARASDIPRVNALIVETLQSGQNIVVFPEGTSTAGASILPFKPSLLEPVARGHFPVAYSSIHYRTPPAEPPAHLSVCWWGTMTLMPHLWGVFRLSAIEATLTFGIETIRGTDRKELAQMLHEAVTTIFTPSTKSETVPRAVASGLELAP